jgi:hypothetical protein
MLVGRSVLSIVIAVALIGAAPPGAASIVGTFNCMTRAGAATFHFHSENQPWGAWVRADTSFPAQAGLSASFSSTFVGYNSDTKQWNIIAINRAGSYYTRTSKSPAFNNSHWTDAYPSDGGKALITVTPRRYTFDLSTPGANGPSTSETVCTRV